MKNREPGFYWVKWNGKDEVAEWTGERWYIAGVDADDDDLENDTLTDISDVRLTREVIKS